MAIARPILGLISLVLVAGGMLLQFLVILSGAVQHSPINKVYFLQAATTGVTGAKNPARWTFFAVCGVVNGLNGNCNKVKAALPFNPPQNFGTETGLPTAFDGTHKFYYLSRFMFAFYLIALFFAACALVTGVLALCTRIGAYLSGLNAAIALFWQTLAAALMTAWTVLGRNAFRSNGQSASLGKYAYGFTWGAMACYLLATVFFCVGGGMSKDKRNRGSSMRRNKSTKSTRGSFIDNESQRRVKDEYE